LASCLTNHTRRRLVVALGQHVAAQEVEDLLCGGSGASDSFSTIQTDSGTSPTATSSTDTLTITGTGGITVIGDATTDTVTISGAGLLLSNEEQLTYTKNLMQFNKTVEDGYTYSRFNPIIDDGYAITVEDGGEFVVL
jgi:hypothetical protein